MSTYNTQRVRLHQMMVHQRDPIANKEEILNRIARARQDGVQLAVFPEWALTGLLGASEWRSSSFMSCCDACLAEIIAATRDIAVILGTACRYRNRILSAVVAAENGKRIIPEGSPLPFVPRLYTENSRFDIFTGTLCANAVAAMEQVPLYRLFTPFKFRYGSVSAWCGTVRSRSHADTAPQQWDAADLRLSLDTRPYTRDTLLQPDTEAPVCHSGVPLLHCGACGVVDTGKTVFVLEGHTGIHFPDGTSDLLPWFDSDILDLPLKSPCRTPAPETHAAPATVIRAMETGCRLMLTRLNLSRVVVGASGGIDSALAAALYSRVTGPENLLLVNMPSRHNSRTTIELARDLAINLGCHYTEVPIEPATELTRRQIDGLTCEHLGSSGNAKLTLSLSNAALENIQARDRSGRVLAAISSAWNGVFTCNANKSETTIGYGTLYGDIAGFFAALADLWKHEIWEIARFYNTTVFGREVIPCGSIEIIPSAELSQAQNVDEGKGDPLIYAWHDCLFAAWTERDPPLSLEALLESYAAGTLAKKTGYNDDPNKLFPDTASFCRELEHMWRLYNGLARAKRVQIPPVLSLKHRTYGFDLGTAQLPTFFSPDYHSLKTRLIKKLNL